MAEGLIRESGALHFCCLFLYCCSVYFPHAYLMKDEKPTSVKFFFYSARDVSIKEGAKLDELSVA